MKTRKLGYLPGEKNRLAIWPRYHDTIGVFAGWHIDRRYGDIRIVWLPTGLVAESAYIIGELLPRRLHRLSSCRVYPHKISIEVDTPSANTSKNNKYLNCLLQWLTIDALAILDIEAWMEYKILQ